MTNVEKLAAIQLDKAVRKAKKRRDSLSVFACMVPVILFAMHPALGVVAALVPVIVWRTTNKIVKQMKD